MGHNTLGPPDGALSQEEWDTVRGLLLSANVPADCVSCGWTGTQRLHNYYVDQAGRCFNCYKTDQEEWEAPPDDV